MSDDREWLERQTCPFTSCPEQGKHTWSQHWLMEWRYPPVPWVRRNPTTCWHLAYGIRLGSELVSVQCRGGRYGHTIPAATAEWRDTPPLGRSYTNPEGRACGLCLARWTKGVDHVTVSVYAVKVTKGQLAKLLEAIPGTDLMMVELKPTQVEGQPALMATVEVDDRMESHKERYLVVGDGVVKL
jgi:hypothetical protein